MAYLKLSGHLAAGVSCPIKLCCRDALGIHAWAPASLIVWRYRTDVKITQTEMANAGAQQLAAYLTLSPSLARL